MSEALRIVIVGSPALGGSGVVAHRIAKGLATRGNRVTFLSYARPFDEASPLVRYEVAEPAPSPLFPFQLYERALTERLYALCMTEQVDVVHAHYATFFGDAAARALRALPTSRRPRFVLTCHGTDIVGTPAADTDMFGTHNLVAGALREADIVTAVSEDLAAQVAKRYLGLHPTWVVPNFVDLALYVPRPKQRRHGLQVLHISNFRPIKQTSLVVDAVRLLGPTASLTLIGEGPEYAQTLARAHKVLSVERVTTYGALESAEIAARMSEADVVMLPSLYESFSLAALEAQSCGIPVVGTTSGGMKEVIMDGATGILVAPDAPAQAWANALCKANHLPNVSVRARQVAERFSTDRALDAYESIYRGREALRNYGKTIFSTTGATSTNSTSKGRRAMTRPSAVSTETRQRPASRGIMAE